MDPMLNDNESSGSMVEHLETIPMNRDLYMAAALGKKTLSFNELNLISDLHLQVTSQKNTALHLAIMSQQEELVYHIMNQFSSLSSRQNSKGDTPLHFAARDGLFEIVKLLFLDPTQGREMRFNEDIENNIGGIQEENKKSLRILNNKKDTALHEAIRYHHINVAKYLLEADPEFQYSANDIGETPLYMAANEGLHEIVVAILRLSPSSSYSGPCGNNALQAAVINDRSEIVRALLEKRVDIIKEVNDEGKSSLHYAALFGSGNSGKQLIDSDKSIAYLQDKDGITALHIAANEGHLDVIRDIISLCPGCCDAIDSRGRNVFHFAVESGNPKFCIELLKDPKFDFLLNEADDEGNTPLHLAAITKQFDIAKVLLGHKKVDKNAMNKKTQTAYDIFMNRDFGSIYKREYIQILYKMYDLNGEIRKGMKVRIFGCLFSKEISEAMVEQMIGQDKKDNGKGKSKDESQGKETDALLLVATLIATVTFTAGFTIPGGYKGGSPNEGMAILSRKTAFKAFLISDTIAMCFSTSAAFTSFLNTCLNSKKSFFYRGIASLLTYFAMYAMLIAFGTGTYVVLPHSHGLAMTTCLISTLFFYVLLVFFAAVEYF